METTERSKRGKVVFVEPNGVHANVFAKFMTIPMLGPLYLGTIAEEAGYDVTILNENILGRDIQLDELEDVDILCLSCMTATVQRGKANTIVPETDALQALAHMRKTDNSRLLVTRGNELLGVVTLKDMLQFLALKLDLENEYAIPVQHLGLNAAGS